MSSKGDKQPLTSPDSLGQTSAGIINRTKRTISTALREKSLKQSSRNNESQEEQGWQNPSYEHTETTENKSFEKVTTEEGLEKQDTIENVPVHHARKDRKTKQRHRKRPAVISEEYEMAEWPGTPAAAVAASGGGTSLKLEDETEAGRGDGSAARRPRGRGGEPAERAASPAGAGQPPEQVLGVMVHQCDRLDGGRWQLSRPMVRVHLADTSTGEPLRKRDPSRQVTYFYEPAGTESILPALTQPSATLSWDELLVFNEPLAHLTGEQPRVFLLLELLESRPQLAAAGWAFLRLRGAGGRLNTGRRLRLQLFRPPADRALRERSVCSWWRAGGRRLRLPATLHVTATAVSPPALEPGRRSLFPTQPESAAAAGGSPERAEPPPAPPAWSRLSGQQCRLPTARLATLADDAESCQALRFDAAGGRLACCLRRAGQFPVLVYAVPSGARTHALLGHAALVYDVRWSDSWLLTASADWTARLWLLAEAGQYQVRVLPHPGYVYAAQFRPAAARHLVTGCFDGVLRVWLAEPGEPAAEPRLEDEQAAGDAPLHSLCCAADGGRLFSGDARGAVSAWLWRGRLSRERCVRPAEVRGAPIDALELHPAGRRLFAQARDGLILALDAARLVTLQTLGGHLNSRALLRGCLSPCGTYFLSGAEDGCLHVWSADSGDRCATYTALGSTRPIASVHFHPWEHMVAAATQRDPRLTVQLLGYRRGESGAALGLSLLPRAIQPAPAAPPRQPPPQPEPSADDRAAAERDDRRFQIILDRLDSVIQVARAGPAGQERARSEDSRPPDVHSRRRRQRRQRKAREALNSTDPLV